MIYELFCTNFYYDNLGGLVGENPTRTQGGTNFWITKKYLG